MNDLAQQGMQGIQAGYNQYNNTNITGIAPVTYNSARAFNQLKEQQPKRNKLQQYTDNMKGDSLIGGGMNAAIAAFQKADKTPLLKSTSQWVLRPAHIGAQFGAGALAAIPQSVVNTATQNVSNRLSNYYANKDSKPSLLHAGMIAAPAVLGGMYSIGAIMHGIDQGTKAFKAKTWSEAGKHLLNAANPIEHIRRAGSETKNAFRDLFTTKKIGFGKRGLAALNIAGLAIGAAIPLINYFKKNKEKREQEKNLAMKVLPYSDDFVNALGAGATQRIVKQASLNKEAIYVPVITPLIRSREAALRMSNLRKELDSGKYIGSELDRASKEVSKNLKNAGYDAMGLGLVGGGYYLYNKHKSKDNNMPFYRRII